MYILEKLREVCFNVATIGKLGEWRGGGFIASLFAFPLLLVSRFFYDVAHYIFYWTVGIFILFYFLIIYLALGFISDRYTSDIVLDRIVGMFIAFAFVPLKWKLMLLGFIMFHVINFFRPFFFYKILEEKIEKFSLSLKIFVGSLLSGLICNIFLQLIIWVMG